MDYSSMLIFLVTALLLLSHARSQSQGHAESSDYELEELDQEATADDESGREGRILRPRLISHVQPQNQVLAHNSVPASHPQTAAGDVLPTIPVSFTNSQHSNDQVNIYSVQLPASHPVIASLDKNDDAVSTGVITGYPVIVHVPDQNQPIAVYRGQFPAFIERILQRIQNRYSVYNPPEYFENKPRPEIELQPPEPPLCVEAADGVWRQQGYAYAPPCPPTTTTTTAEPPTTIAEGYAYEEPKPGNTTYNVFNGTIILINCTDLQLPSETTTPTTTTTTSTPYVYPAPTTTTTTETPPVSGPYYYPPFAPPQGGELFIIHQKPTSSPPPPPPSLYLPPSTDPPPPNTYLPPISTTTTTTTTTTPASSYLPPEIPNPSTNAPLYLPPEPPKPSTAAPLYLPPETPRPSTATPPSAKPSTRVPFYIPPEPAPIYLPPKPIAPSYLPPLPLSTSTKGPASYVVNSSGKGSVAQPSNININIHGYQHTNQLQPLLPFPLRFLQFKKLLLAKLLNLN